MTPLRRAIKRYLTLRRRLGVTLHEAERVLMAFTIGATSRAELDDLLTRIQAASVRS